MELIRILEALERYSEETVAYKLDATFAHAVSEAAVLLVSQGERIADMEAEKAKPLTEFLAPMDEYKGLKRKFLVFKSNTGERIENCFVLRPDRDPAAVEALIAYARATENKDLALDIFNWVSLPEPLHVRNKEE